MGSIDACGAPRAARTTDEGTLGAALTTEVRIYDVAGAFPRLLRQPVERPGTPDGLNRMYLVLVGMHNTMCGRCHGQDPIPVILFQ
jgi:hypothetical protein